MNMKHVFSTFSFNRMWSNRSRECTMQSIWNENGDIFCYSISANLHTKLGTKWISFSLHQNSLDWPEENMKTDARWIYRFPSASHHSLSGYVCGRNSWKYPILIFPFPIERSSGWISSKSQSDQCEIFYSKLIKQKSQSTQGRSGS